MSLYSHNYYRLRACLVLSSVLLAMPVVAPAAPAVAPAVTTLSDIREGASSPAWITVGQSGKVYVSDSRSGIVVYSDTGSKLYAFRAARKVYGVGIAVNGDMLAVQGDSVAVLDPSTGAKKSQFGTFVGANSIAVDAVGNIYVTDTLNSCIQVFSPSYAPVAIATAAAGKPSNSFGTFGRSSGQFIRPIGIRYEKLSGQLAIVDSATGQVQFYTTTGGFVKSIGSLDVGPLIFTSPQTVTFEYSPDGSALSRIYVVDAFQSNVKVIDAATGTYLTSIGGYGTTAGKLFTPGDVFFDAFDSGNNRLLVTNGTGGITRFGIGKVTGTCGPANGASFSVLLSSSSGLCSNGTVANFAGSGPWSWDCAGQNGGAAATCSASLPSYLLAITVDTLNSSGGTISSNPAGISCQAGTCSYRFPAGSSVALTPTPNISSSFTGWSGDCAGTNICTVSMSADRAATATFDLIPRARIGATPYGSLVSAYAAVPAGGVIEAQALLFTENLNLNAGKSLTIKGGFDQAYFSQSGYTVLNGKLTINSGRLTADRLVIR